MKLTILQNEFAKSLNLVSRFVSSRAQLPILGNIKLEATKNRLLVMATNLENSIAVAIGAKVLRPGELAVPAKAISELIGGLGPGTISLTANKEQLEIESDNFKGKVLGVNTSDFPFVPVKLPPKSMKIEQSIFKGALERTLFAVSSDDTRPVLTGILFMLEKNKLVLASSDGFRLSQVEMDLVKNSLTERLIIPKNALVESGRAFEKENGQIDFLFDKENSQVILGAGDTVLTSRVIEGEFPDFTKIIPSSFRVTVNLEREELLRAVKTSSVFARDSGNIIRLKVENGGMRISSESAKTGSQEAFTEGKIDGDEGLEISFNYRFIEEFLNVASGSEVEIKFNDTTSPGVFLDPKSKNFLHLIMPVRS